MGGWVVVRSVPTVLPNRKCSSGMRGEGPTWELPTVSVVSAVGCAQRHRAWPLALGQLLSPGSEGTAGHALPPGIPCPAYGSGWVTPLPLTEGH